MFMREKTTSSKLSHTATFPNSLAKQISFKLLSLLTKYNLSLAAPALNQRLKIVRKDQQQSG